MSSRASGHDAFRSSVDDVVGASRSLVGVAARSLAPLERDVTLSQWRALVLVADSRVSGPGDLAVALGVHPSNATRVVERMVAKKLLTRTETQAGRRTVSLSLGEQGRAALRLVTSHRRTAVEAILEDLPRNRVSMMTEALNAFAAAAGEAADDAWRLGWNS